jgi:hypothetical protein
LPSPAIEEKSILRSIARLRAGVMAIVVGTLSGTALLVATVWLLIRGGENVGQHLGLLSNFFPGYSVSWTGSVVGFLWGALAGAAVGWLTAWVYNRVAGRRLNGSR